VKNNSDVNAHLFNYYWAGKLQAEHFVIGQRIATGIEGKGQTVFV